VKKSTETACEERDQVNKVQKNLETTENKVAQKWQRV
jgi:hypothetical protein